MNVKSKQNALDKIEIAAPCTVSWDDMKGDNSIRDCSQCKLSVYNISEMSKKEAEKLIQGHEGRLCVRLYRRFDGTIITDDCPIGLRKIRQSLKVAGRAAAAVLSLILGVSMVQADETKSSKDSNVSKKNPGSTRAAGQHTMGAICPLPKTPVINKTTKTPSADKSK